MLLNFNSGPAALPEEVLREASSAILEYENSGISILGLPHRSKSFTAILEEAEFLAKSLLDLGDDYEILWMQGGGRLQFSMVPMNFLDEGETAGYIDSGHWSADAMKSAELYGRVKVLASSKAEDYRFIPEIKTVREPLSYVHLTSNNTIYGTQFFDFPESSVPLIADMSSELFSRRLDYRRFDLIYAVAQKNIGPAGVTFAAIKKSLLSRQKRTIPGILSYREIARQHSVLNTPPVFAIYCSLLNLRWINNLGMEAIEKRNATKAKMLYTAIDESFLFSGIAAKAHRSMMNVCFKSHSPETDTAFIEFALKHNITGISGHRSVGGLRVALYNPISPEAVEQLVAVMKQFEQKQAL
jgi:phosphoserine aminotransferase